MTWSASGQQYMMSLLMAFVVTTTIMAMPTSDQDQNTFCGLVCDPGLGLTDTGSQNPVVGQHTEMA